MTYLTSDEERLLLAALRREREACQKIDEDKIDDETCKMLVPVMESLERKLIQGQMGNKVYNQAVDDCITILDTVKPSYMNAQNDRYDMMERLRELKR